MTSIDVSADVRHHVPESRPPLPVLRVIVGPTAAGKSSLAVRIADAVGASIISADSRQVYRGFDIGTAKPGRAERARTPHFGIDIAEPTERISADDWSRRVGGWVASIVGSGRQPLIVGGTGFYVRALFEPLFAAPHVDPKQRHALASYLERLSTFELRRWCAALDAPRAALGRAQLLRAVETAMLTGCRLSDLHERSRRAPVFAASYLLVDPGRVLAERIVDRVQQMVTAGWMEEVEALARSVPPSAPAWSATGYDALRLVAAGELPLQEAMDRVVIATRQYAKRQRTWFRHQLDALRVTKINPTDADAFERAIAWWNGDGV